MSDSAATPRTTFKATVLRVSLRLLTAILLGATPRTVNRAGKLTMMAAVGR